MLRLSSSTSKNECCALTPHAFLLFHTILGSYVYKIGWCCTGYSFNRRVILIPDRRSARGGGGCLASSTTSERRRAKWIFFPSRASQKKTFKTYFTSIGAAPEPLRVRWILIPGCTLRAVIFVKMPFWPIYATRLKNKLYHFFLQDLPVSVLLDKNMQKILWTHGSRWQIDSLNTLLIFNCQPWYPVNLFTPERSSQEGHQAKCLVMIIFLKLFDELTFYMLWRSLNTGMGVHE